MSSLYDIFLRCRKVCTDSRAIEPGSIFFALTGDSFNGNHYAVAALQRGAAYAVTDDRDAVIDGAAKHSSLSYEQCAERIVECEDVLFALQILAAEHRKHLGIPILAITGSNGKTTTKELVSRVLSRKYNVATTRGNLNNHIGVPLTLLAMNANVEFGVVEMGASSCGEIELLSAIAQPDFGLITNIGRAHLEGFGGIEGVKRGKGELCDYIAEHSGVMFYLEESEALREIVEKHTNMKCVAYSEQLADGVKTNLEGDYNRFNIAAAVAVGQYFDIDQSDIADAIKSYIPDNNRSQRLEGERNSLIVDCYNANPSSVAVALTNFAQIVGVVRDKCVILGDMLELGEYTDIEHEAVIDSLMTRNLREAYLVGSNFCRVASQMREHYGDKMENVRCFEDRVALLDYLAEHPISEHFILIKGSRGIGLEKTIERL